MLIVDDDKRMVELLAGNFESTFEIKCASNGAEAIKIFTKEPFDIVIMDIIMPVIDGIEASRALKISQPDIKIIAITCHTDSEELIEAIKPKTDALVFKPFSLKKLTEKVNELLK